MNKLKNVHLSHLSEYSTRTAACFETEDARYHIWFDYETGQREETLYKNPLHGVNPHSEGYFHTRRLDATNKANRPIVDALFAEVEEKGLVAKAKQELAEKETARQAENLRLWEIGRKQEAGPELYDALAGLLSWLPADEASIRRNYGADLLTLWQAARAAMAKADPPLEGAHG